jgi:hypothetical protein
MIESKPGGEDLDRAPVLLDQLAAAARTRSAHRLTTTPANTARFARVAQSWEP